MKAAFKLFCLSSFALSVIAIAAPQPPLRVGRKDFSSKFCHYPLYVLSSGFLTHVFVGFTQLEIQPNSSRDGVRRSAEIFRGDRRLRLNVSLAVSNKFTPVKGTDSTCDINSLGREAETIPALQAESRVPVTGHTILPITSKGIEFRLKKFEGVAISPATSPFRVGNGNILDMSFDADGKARFLYPDFVLSASDYDHVIRERRADGITEIEASYVSALSTSNGSVSFKVNSAQALRDTKDALLRHDQIREGSASLDNYRAAFRAALKGQVADRSPGVTLEGVTTLKNFAEGLADTVLNEVLSAEPAESGNPRVNLDHAESILSRRLSDKKLEISINGGTAEFDTEPVSAQVRL